MLSRVCSKEQLYIVDALDPEKITVDENVKKEAARMEKISLNKNPSKWMSPATLGLKVCSFNTLSLRRHIEDIKSDPILLQSQVLCLQETWLEDGEEEDGRYQLEGFTGYFTSVGRGKGLAVYVREEVEIGRVNKFAEPNIQLTKITTSQLDIVTLYRSQEEPLFRAVHFLQNLINPKKDTLVIGDFNYDANKKNDLSKYLEKEGFTQLVTLPTHIRGGINILPNTTVLVINPCKCHNLLLSGVIDQAHLRATAKLQAEVTTCSHYYSDHDSVTCVLEMK